MAWFKRQSGELDTSGEKKVRTEGLWVKCENCRQIIWKKDLEDNLNVCPKCDKHFRIDARTRLAQLLDDNEYEVFDANLASTDPLKFVDLKAYSSRLKQAQARHRPERRRHQCARQAERPPGDRQCDGVCVHRRQHGSGGGRGHHPRHRAGHRDQRMPLIIVSASGGARMMEGVISLMQLAKISAALARLDEAKVPYISV